MQIMVRSPSSYGSIYLLYNLERIQQKSTRFMLGDIEMNYKSRLIHLNLLSLCYFLEYLDLLFLFHRILGEIVLLLKKAARV